MSFIASFFAGALLCNCLPHLLCGLLGAPFPSPFAQPRGVGDSSPLVNFLWGAFNLFAGLALLDWHPLAFGVSGDSLAFVAGFLALGISLSLHFGKVRRDRNGK
jgi:hypothetical protein